MKRIAFAALFFLISATGFLQYHSYSGGNSPTTFENIRIENLDCKEAKAKAISIVGLPEMPISNVELENVTIHKAGEMSEITNVKNMNWSNVNF